MKQTNIVARIARVLGSFALVIGLALAELLFVPTGDPSSSGLYRWKLPDGEVIVYGYDRGAIWTSLGVVVTAATSSLIVGSFFLFISRHLGRAQKHREPNAA